MLAVDDSKVPMRALLAGARRRQPELLRLLEQLVRAESPSDDKQAVEACMAIVADHLSALGVRIKWHKLRQHANVLEARFGPRVRSADRRTLVLGHLDTVWPLGTLQTMPWRQSNGCISGPGVLDMKSGVAMAITALELLAEAELLDHEVVLLLTGDEEIGSPSSRPVLEKIAATCASVLVPEPAQGLAVKTARKGTGIFRLDVHGVAAHSGVDFAAGASALHELAQQIAVIASWTDISRGLTVNVGQASGGTRTNVVAAHAWAEIDVRIARVADGPRIEKKFARLKPFDRRCSLVVSGGLNRPPMERKRPTVALYRKARALAAELDIVLDEASTGGASDGNFTAALGLGTLDGLGAVGSGAHASTEHIVVEHLAFRTALLAGLLAG